jgi:hypothetical protein
MLAIFLFILEQTIISNLPALLHTEFGQILEMLSLLLLCIVLGSLMIGRWNGEL